MRQSSSLCDVTLRSDDGTNICAHSIILASGSSVFHAHLLERKATFLEQTHLSTILLRGVTADVLQVTLDFIYGITPETIADFKKLRIGAEKLGIDGAKAFCVQQIRELEAVGNVDDVASTSTSSSSPHSSATTSTTGDQNDQLCVVPPGKKEVDIAKCPYFSNKGAEIKYYVPLKKRFFMKMLSELKKDHIRAAPGQFPLEERELKKFDSDSDDSSSSQSADNNNSSPPAQGSRSSSQARVLSQCGDNNTQQTPGSYCLENSSNRSISEKSGDDSLPDLSPPALCSDSQQNESETTATAATGEAMDLSLLDIGPEFISNAKEFIPHPVADLSSADYVRCPHLKELINNDGMDGGFNDDGSATPAVAATTAATQMTHAQSLSCSNTDQVRAATAGSRDRQTTAFIGTSTKSAGDAFDQQHYAFNISQSDCDDFNATFNSSSDQNGGGGGGGGGSVSFARESQMFSSFLPNYVGDTVMSPSNFRQFVPNDFQTVPSDFQTLPHARGQSRYDLSPATSRDTVYTASLSPASGLHAWPPSPYSLSPPLTHHSHHHHNNNNSAVSLPSAQAQQQQRDLVVNQSASRSRFLPATVAATVTSPGEQQQQQSTVARAYNTDYQRFDVGAYDFANEFMACDDHLSDAKSHDAKLMGFNVNSPLPEAVKVPAKTSAKTKKLSRRTKKSDAASSDFVDVSKSRAAPKRSRKTARDSTPKESTNESAEIQLTGSDTAAAAAAGYLQEHLPQPEHIHRAHCELKSSYKSAQDKATPSGMTASTYLTTTCLGHIHKQPSPSSSQKTKGK